MRFDCISNIFEELVKLRVFYSRFQGHINCILFSLPFANIFNSSSPWEKLAKLMERAGHHSIT